MGERENSLQTIKRLFFTYRNGMLADTLRGYGDPHKIIFGLDIPRIATIAREFSQDMELARALWEDKEVRESRLLATYLFPIDETDKETVLELCSGVITSEEADMLAFRLLKRLPYALEILDEMKNKSENGNWEDRPSTMAYKALAQHFPDRD